MTKILLEPKKWQNHPKTQKKITKITIKPKNMTEITIKHEKMTKIPLEQKKNWPNDPGKKKPKLP